MWALLMVAALAACGDDRATLSSESSPVTTTTTPATTTTSTPVPTTTTIPPAVDPRVTAEPLDVQLTCNADGACVSVAIVPGGDIAVFDAATRTLRFLADGRTVELGAEFGSAWLSEIGPQGVAYFTVIRVAGGDQIGDLVAVPTDGPRAGQVMARADEAIDTSGDSTLVPTAAGLVSVGCCGHAGRQPALDARPLLPWIGRDGAVLAPLPTEMWLEYPASGGVVVVRSDAGVERRWSLPDATGGRDMPPVAATAEGGARLLVHDGLGAPDVPGELYDLGADGSVERYRVGVLRWAMLDADQLVVMTDEGMRRIVVP